MVKETREIVNKSMKRNLGCILGVSSRGYMVKPRTR